MYVINGKLTVFLEKRAILGRRSLEQLGARSAAGVSTMLAASFDHSDAR